MRPKVAFPTDMQRQNTSRKGEGGTIMHTLRNPAFCDNSVKM